MERSMSLLTKKDLKLPKRAATASKEEEKCIQKTKGRQKLLHLTDNEK